jgi:hypothetical protein
MVIIRLFAAGIFGIGFLLLSDYFWRKYAHKFTPSEKISHQPEAGADG